MLDCVQYGKFDYGDLLYGFKRKNLLNGNCDSMECYKEAFIDAIAKEPSTRTDKVFSFFSIEVPN